MTQNRMQEFYNLTYKFNEIAGKFDNITDKSYAEQVKLITEEVKETVEAVKARNKEATLDGYTDIAVTFFGLVMLLEKGGVLDKIPPPNTENYHCRTIDFVLSDITHMLKIQKEYIVKWESFCTHMYSTIALLEELLKEQGYDTEEALIATANNNLTKFIPKENHNVLAESVQALPGVTATFNKKYNVYVLKDENNKIRKPVGFVSNSLIRFVPKEVV